MDFNRLISGLCLVRIGQELGTDSPLSRAIFQILSALKEFPC